MAEGQVHLFHIVRRKHRNEPCRRSRMLDTKASLCLLAFDQAHDADNLEAKFARSFDGLDRRGSSRADVIDDHYPGALFAKALDALTSTMLFLSLTYQECVDIAAYDGDRYSKRISTHRQPADRFRIPTPRANLIQKNLSRQLSAACIERRGSAIDVVLAGASRGELELAKTKRLGCEQAQQFLSRSKHEPLRIPAKTKGPLAADLI